MKQVLLLCVSLIFSFALSNAQVKETRGTMTLIEGRRYYVAFPQVWGTASEKPLNPAMMLFVSSRMKAKIRIQTPAAINQAARLDREYTLEPHKVLQIPISTAYMNTESESREGYGILVTGDKPISVSTFQAWFGNGELARHLPTEAWGMKYYSMNFYQDRFGMTAGTMKYRPSQILIVSESDNTVVTYTPTVDTEGGREAPSVKKGTTQSVTLEKGETFLIKDKIDQTLYRDFRSDLSGTLITSTKPIGVVSGHTKVAIMRYPDVLPPSGMYATEAHFVRNNIHEAMLPIEMAGTEFVTVPFKYTPTRQTGYADTTEWGIDDDRGDVIRVIALADNTTIKMLDPDTHVLAVKWVLDSGETKLDTVAINTCYWQSDKPILMGQYGKSYAKVLPPESRKHADETQGHPVVESGMPCLTNVPSIDRWTSYGTFKSPEGMDNFFNIVYKTTDGDKIKMDGKSITVAFATSVRALVGTPYSFIRTPIGAGDHLVESETDNIKWGAWTYGSLDGLQQGRAYATPVSIDLSIPCVDSLVVSESIDCGNVTSSGKITPEGVACGSIFAVYAEALTNYELIIDENFFAGQDSVNYFVNIIDQTKDASATVNVISRSGEFVEKEYSYIADKLDWNAKNVNFGVISYNTPETKTFTITNTSTDRPLVVNDLRAKYFPNVYDFSPKTFTIPAGGSQIVTVTAVITDAREKLDTVIAVLDCFEQQTVELRVRGEEPKIYVADQTWENIPCESPGIRKDVEIRNGSDVDLIITAYRETLLPMIDDGVSHFFAPMNLKEQLPITLRGGQSHTFSVMYSPRGDTSLHRVEVPFTSNAVIVDSFAVLTGSCDSATNIGDELNATASVVSPMPVVLSRDATFTLTVPTTATHIRIIDALGREMTSLTLENVERVVLNSEILHSSGMYCVSISTSHGERIVPLICIE